MTIVIGYVPTPVGEAALEAGLAEAKAHGDDVVHPQQPAPPHRPSTASSSTRRPPTSSSRAPPRPG